MRKKSGIVDKSSTDNAFRNGISSFIETTF